MATERSSRSRFETPDMREIFRKNQKSPAFNVPLHDFHHSYDTIVYTSKKNLTTDTSTKFYSPYSGDLAWVYANVQGAPSSTMKIDVLLDGFSVFESSSAMVEILSGQTRGYQRITEKKAMTAVFESMDPMKLEVKINTVAAATGPMVVYIGVQRAA